MAYGELFLFSQEAKKDALEYLVEPVWLDILTFSVLEGVCVLFFLVGCRFLPMVCGMQVGVILILFYYHYHYGELFIFLQEAKKDAAEVMSSMFVPFAEFVSKADDYDKIIILSTYDHITCTIQWIFAAWKALISKTVADHLICLGVVSSLSMIPWQRRCHQCHDTSFLSRCSASSITSSGTSQTQRGIRFVLPQQDCEMDGGASACHLGEVYE